jgi:hypothetical protein
LKVATFQEKVAVAKVVHQLSFSIALVGVDDACFFTEVRTQGFFVSNLYQ